MPLYQFTIGERFSRADVAERFNLEQEIRNARSVVQAGKVQYWRFGRPFEATRCGLQIRRAIHKAFVVARIEFVEEIFEKKRAILLWIGRNEFSAIDLFHFNKAEAKDGIHSLI